MATGRNNKLTKKSSEFKYVYLREGEKGYISWVASIFGKTIAFKTEREAAIFVDKQFIIKGKKPVNVLVKI